MSERVTETTNQFLVQRNDGSQEAVIERTTFLIKRSSMSSAEPPSRAPIQVEWFLDGNSLIRDQSDQDVFRDGITQETFRRVR